jgi:hypothetical protein
MMLPYRPLMEPYSAPALEAELAQKRDLLMKAGLGTRSRRGAWFRNRNRRRSR